MNKLATYTLNGSLVALALGGCTTMPDDVQVLQRELKETQNQNTQLQTDLQGLEADLAARDASLSEYEQQLVQLFTMVFDKMNFVLHASILIKLLLAKLVVDLRHVVDGQQMLVPTINHHTPPKLGHLNRRRRLAYIPLVVQMHYESFLTTIIG